MIGIITIWSIFPVSYICKLLWGSARKKLLVQEHPCKKKHSWLKYHLTFLYPFKYFLAWFFLPAHWLQISIPSNHHAKAFLFREVIENKNTALFEKISGFWVKALSIAGRCNEEFIKPILDILEKRKPSSGFKKTQLHFSWGKQTKHNWKKWNVVVLKNLLFPMLPLQSDLCRTDGRHLCDVFRSLCKLANTGL